MSINANKSKKHSPIELSGRGKPCRVLGHPKPALSDEEYQVVEALVSAYPDSVTREALEAACGTTAHGVLLSLRKKDTSWATAILVPTRAGRGGYRLL